MEAKRKIEIGKVYSTKVGGSWLPVRIDKSLGHGRYEGAPLPSGKTIKVSTDAVKGDGQTLEQWTAARTPRPAQEPEPTKPTRTDGGEAKPRAKAVRPAKEKKDRKPSALDAAATVLAEAKAPLTAKEMVERMLAKGLWQTGGKTPAATIYAAIIREIAAKGADARFRKAERGKFTLAK